MQNVAEGRVLGALGELGVFRCRELALKTIQQAVQHEALALVDRKTGDSFPETCLREDGAEGRLRAIDGATKTGEEPFHPGRDVQGPLLHLLEDVVVAGALLPDLR